MELFDILFPIIFITLGAVCLFYSKPVATHFCRFGKASWKAATFGLTDMHWFYSEEKSPTTFKIMGGGLLVFGFAFLTFFVFSLRGPGSLDAMREAKIHLKQVYGDSSGRYRVSTAGHKDDEKVLYVDYDYSGRSGRLKGVWTGDRYIFSEEKDEIK